MPTESTSANAHPVDAALAALRLGTAAWADLSYSDRIDLLDRVSVAINNHAAKWVQVAAEIKGLDPQSPLLGEEWVTGPYPVLAGVAALKDTIRALRDRRSPVDGCTMHSAPGNRVAVRVLPHDNYDRLLLSGFTAEVWTTPGVTPAEVRAKAGLGQRRLGESGGIGAVLGAGNLFSIAPLDALYELFAYNRVVALKLNPLADPLLPVFEEAFAPLIESNFLRILSGGPEMGSSLVRHSDVDHVHMTGSSTTHDAIVFGSGEEGRSRKAKNAPVLEKPISSELGGVSPIIVLPGRWSRRDLAYQAEHIVTQKLHNNGYNCVAAQVVIVSSDWAQKEQFLQLVEDGLRRAPHRADYYPGSASRVEKARNLYGAQASFVAGTSRTLIRGLTASAGDTAFNTEFFAPVLGVTEMPGQGPEFLRAAVASCNAEFAGTLGVNVIAHPSTLRMLGDELDRAIAELRYGTIGINAWTGVAFLTARASWGAFPGHVLNDVQSGIGVVHNALLLDDVERTVVRGPFRPASRALFGGEFTLSPKPLWFVTGKTATKTARRLTRFAASPSWSALPGIFSSALRN